MEARGEQFEGEAAKGPDELGKRLEDSIQGLEIQEPKPGRSGLAAAPRITVVKRNILAEPVAKAMRKLKRSVGPNADGPVNFRCGNEVFRVNKLLLAVRSQKLYSLVLAVDEVPCGSKAQPELLLPGEDTEIMRSMFEFLYSSKSSILEVEGTFENQMKLFKAALKYDIKDLSQRAFLALCTKVSVETWTQLLLIYQENEDCLKPTNAFGLLKRYYNRHLRDIMYTGMYLEHQERIDWYLYCQLSPATDNKKPPAF